ncbi:hypothetical protein [Anaerotignum propionicum]|nr:hypothetical protein [Anaerotignum propionicum]
MGTISKIDHSFWQDDFVLSLTPAGRYFFNYLISNGPQMQWGAMKWV